MPPHRCPGAGPPPDGGAARLRRCGIARRGIAFHRLDPEWAGARIRPESERAARRAAEGAVPRGARRHDPAAGAARSGHRARPGRSRTLPRRMTAPTLFTIGYEKALLGDVLATLTRAGVATLID